ncbi:MULTISPECIES: SIS domain-containing protein [unclassified Arthrobacter]|uniref:SIS domain-containing protein n=1 Tax=unclassified Arthrobacter TaxID=235627 RepID=UPI001F02E03E|nr:SIS domain-containing protein [Arthrobacter sp. FW305-BF8]UKA56396.1 SIS domain-containing protein [Arthrobacter sp. FW305-BF8]
MKAVSRLSRTRATDAPFEMKAPVDVVLEHLRQVGPAVACLRNESSRLAGWGEELARRLVSGNRLVTAGSAGSAAEVQQFTAELLGRHAGDRQPFSVIALRPGAAAAGAAPVSAVEIAQGHAEEVASQVRAHIRSDDVLLAVSASGHRHALLEATAAARAAGATVWAVTGAAPNPLAQAADEAICINAPKPQVREAQLIALQAMSECLAAALHALSVRPESRR